MNKIKIKRFLSVLTSFCIMGAVPLAFRNKEVPVEQGSQAVTEQNKAELLGVSDSDEYFLGAASRF